MDQRVEGKETEGVLDAEREGTMTEHENDTRLPDQLREPTGFEHDEAGAPMGKGDLVVDLSGITELSLASLAMLLTAQQKAEKEDRDVWLAGVPLHLWKALNAMGLGRFFKPFPVSG
ncbi:MAG: STAS domain-containing protein, partial [Gemmatimonadetes bacterium]|nr:STAS domain-containing protein [Gemmatimonadota bacterium]